MSSEAQLGEVMVDLGRVDADQRVAGAGDEPELNVLPEELAEHPAHPADRLVQVQGARFGRLPAREREEVPGELRRALGGPLDLAQVLGRRAPRVEPFEGQRRMPLDY